MVSVISAESSESSLSEMVIDSEKVIPAIYGTPAINR